MYADRVEEGNKRSIKDRLNGSSLQDSGRLRKMTGKRQRQDDDKWEHDLYDEPQVSNRKVGARDLRLKLQKKGLQPMLDRGVVRDLREKLSGSQPLKTESSRPKLILEASKPARKSVAVETPPETKKPANPPPKKKSQQKAGSSVDEFLQSLGLEKYQITFQAEEVDMTALIHMTDEDLKALGIPMGPRKKILLALDSRV